MEKIEVATAAKGSVELLNLSAKTQEKHFYSIYTVWVLKHNIHTLYKVSRAHFRWNNLRVAHSKRYTEKYSPKEQLRYALQGSISVYLWVKAYKNLVQHYHHSWAHSCGILYQKILSSLISSYSIVTHVHYGRHVTDCSWLSSVSLYICTLVNGYDA